MVKVDFKVRLGAAPIYRWGDPAVAQLRTCQHTCPAAFCILHCTPQHIHKVGNESHVPGDEASMIPLFTTGDKGKVASGIISRLSRAGIYLRSLPTKHLHTSHPYNNYIINMNITFQQWLIATDSHSMCQVINMSFIQSRSITLCENPKYHPWHNWGQ